MFPVEKPASLAAITPGCDCHHPPLILPSRTLAPDNSRSFSCGFCGVPMTVEGGIHIIECPCKAGPCQIQFVVDPKTGKIGLHYTCRLKSCTDCTFSKLIWSIQLDVSATVKTEEKPEDGVGGSGR